MTLVFGAGGGHSKNGGGPESPVYAGATPAAPILMNAQPARSTAEDQFACLEPVTGVAGMAAANSLRVLIVEDDPGIGPLLAEVLEDLGHIVCAIETNANAAVSAARLHRPDLMIVDIKLGLSNGISAVKEILQQGFVPHVFVTGDALRGLPLGPGAVLLQKPYRPSDLMIAIARAIAASPALDGPA